MVNAGKTTIQLPQKTAPYNTSDFIVIVYGANTYANTSNTGIAQTAIIPISALFANTANLAGAFANLQVSVQQSDPANSSALTVQQGTLFFSNSYGYIAIANNTLMRWAITSF